MRLTRKLTKAKSIICKCGTKLNKYNLWYFINEFNERVPICSKCARICIEVFHESEIEIIKKNEVYKVIQ